MSNIIAYVTVTEDDFWQNHAAELRDNLAQFGLELYIDTVSRSRIESFDLESKYSMCDHAFIEFAEQESRRVLLLNAEIRMHKPMPQEWIDSNLSVIFYNKPRSLGIDINNGQGIWDRMGVAAYRRAMDVVRERGLTQEEVEENTVEWLGPHIKASMSLDRFVEPDAEATRGYWIGPSTVFTHPYIDGLALRARRTLLVDPVTQMPYLRHRDFINHFSPDDEQLTARVYDLVLRNIKIWSPYELPLTGPVRDIKEDMPGNLFKLPGGNHLVYSIDDWKFCPSLGLLAPQVDWPQHAYKIAELDDGR